MIRIWVSSGIEPTRLFDKWMGGVIRPSHEWTRRLQHLHCVLLAGARRASLIQVESRRELALDLVIVGEADGSLHVHFDLLAVLRAVGIHLRGKDRGRTEGEPQARTREYEKEQEQVCSLLVGEERTEKESRRATNEPWRCMLATMGGPRAPR